MQLWVCSYGETQLLTFVLAGLPNRLVSIIKAQFYRALQDITSPPLLNSIGVVHGEQPHGQTLTMVMLFLSGQSLVGDQSDPILGYVKSLKMSPLKRSLKREGALEMML